MLAALAAASGWAGCKKKVARSPIPHIAEVQLLTDSVDTFHYNFLHFGGIEDTAAILFSYTDGDADLGNDATSSSGIYLKDSRDSSVAVYLFPEIPGQLLKPDEGMEGRSAVFLTGDLYLPPTNPLQIDDTVTYELFVKDRAGNESNHVTLPPLRLKPL